MVSKKQQAFVQQGPKPEGIGSLLPTVCLAVIFALVSSWFQMRMVELERNNNSHQIAQTIQALSEELNVMNHRITELEAILADKEKMRGPAGPTGTQGETGPQGPAGAQGLPGSQGPAGETGGAGVPGAAGTDGADGVDGTSGVNGADGARGEQGARGERGPQGKQGTAGSQGAAGKAGKHGSAGDVGPAGPAGPAGPQGSTGPQGQHGDDGARGPQGLQGPQGESGDRGTAGIQGGEGVQGERGERGRGEPGVKVTSMGDSGNLPLLETTCKQFITTDDMMVCPEKHFLSSVTPVEGGRQFSCCVIAAAA